MMSDKEDTIEILCYPDDLLRRKAPPVREISDSIVRRAEAMLDAMYEAEGVGLAGPQIGWNARVFVIDAEQDRSGNRIWFNPNIVSFEGSEESDEGCLSLPGIRGSVERPARIKVSAYDAEGRKHEMDLEGLFARAWQHETDHLDGILFIDHLSPISRLRIRSQLKTLEREAKKSGRTGMKPAR